MKQKTLPVQTRLDQNNFKKLAEAANKKGISISLMVRIILMENLEKSNG
jgi:hypothetical protein